MGQGKDNTVEYFKIWNQEFTGQTHEQILTEVVPNLLYPFMLPSFSSVPKIQYVAELGK